MPGRQGPAAACTRPPLHLLPRGLFLSSWLSPLTSLLFPRPGWEEAPPPGDAPSPRGRCGTRAGGRWGLRRVGRDAGLLCSCSGLRRFGAVVARAEWEGPGWQWWQGAESLGAAGLVVGAPGCTVWAGGGGAPSPAGTGEPGLCGGRMLSGMVVPASSLWTVCAAAPFSGHERKRNGTRGPPSQVGPPTPILPGSPQRQVCPALPGARLDPTQNRKC